MAVRSRAVDVEPFGACGSFKAEFGQICVEVGVVEILHRTIVVHSAALPFQVSLDIDGVGLLGYAILYRLLVCVADLHPTIVTGYLRS